MDFKQKFEPKGNKIIHGAGQSPKRFNEYWNSLEKNKPLIFMTYYKFKDTKKWIDKTKKALEEKPNLILQIGLKMTMNTIVNSEIQKIDFTKEILEGKYDKELNRFLKTIREIKNPVFIRIGYEFDWPNRFKPKRFIKAWRYIVDRIREKKIDNIATVWCSCPFPGTSSVEQYYPGDNYVDWFGIDVFSIKNFKDDRYKPVKEFLELAEKHKKPVMVGESTPARVGVGDGKKSWDSWFKPYFKWLERHKVIKAFCYINWDWGVDYTKPEWLNAKIQDNVTIRKNYVRELKKSKYIHYMDLEDYKSISY